MISSISSNQTEVELRYLPFAEGPVDPTSRLERGEISEEIIKELAARISDGEFTL